MSLYLSGQRSERGAGGGYPAGEGTGGDNQTDVSHAHRPQTDIGQAVRGGVYAHRVDLETVAGLAEVFRKDEAGTEGRCGQIVTGWRRRGRVL